MTALWAVRADPACAAAQGKIPPSAPEKALVSLENQGFFHAQKWGSTLSFTLYRFSGLFLPGLKPVEIVLHSVGAVLLHLLGNVPVNVKRKRRRGVSDVGLYRL